jgi:hypothetical protein
MHRCHLLDEAYSKSIMEEAAQQIFADTVFVVRFIIEQRAHNSPAARWN